MPKVIQNNSYIRKCNRIRLNKETPNKKSRLRTDFPAMTITRYISIRYEEHRVVKDEIDLCSGDESENALDNVNLLNTEQMKIMRLVQRSSPSTDPVVHVNFLLQYPVNCGTWKGRSCPRKGFLWKRGIPLGCWKKCPLSNEVPLSINEHFMCDITKQSSLTEACPARNTLDLG